jgi:outer membrane protein assembly factor BamB
VIIVVPSWKFRHSVPPRGGIRYSEINPPEVPPMHALLVVLLACAADWPHWRGPNRDGVSGEPSGFDGKRWIDDKPAWSRPVGEGCTSPLVVKGRLYTLGHFKGKDYVLCLDAKTGKDVWRGEYPCPRHGRHHMGDEGMYGGPTSTPELADGRLFTLSTDGDLMAWDAAAGKRLWGFNLYDRYKMGRRPKVGTGGQQRDYGYTTAPLALKGRLLVEVGGKDGTVMAFDPKTGDRLWASECKDLAGHTGAMAPMTIDGIPCVATLTIHHLLIVRLDEGHEGKTLHQLPWATEFANNIAGPAVSGQSVLVTSGYNIAKIARFDVTAKAMTKKWERPVYSKACTPVIHGGRVYWVWQKVRCLDFATGEQLWEGGGFADPGSCVVTSDGRLIVWGGTGRLALLEASAREYTELALKPRVFTVHAWPHVTPSGGRLFVKDRQGNLKAFEVPR